MDTQQPIPDISRLFIGAQNEFEVETVFAKKGSISPDETHDYDEIFVLLSGQVELQIGDEKKPLRLDHEGDPSRNTPYHPCT